MMRTILISLALNAALKKKLFWTNAFRNVRRDSFLMENIVTRSVQNMGDGMTQWKEFAKSQRCKVHTRGFVLLELRKVCSICVM